MVLASGNGFLKVGGGLAMVDVAMGVAVLAWQWCLGGVYFGESGFGSGFLMVGVGLVVVADSSGCESGFWFLQWLSNDG